MFRRMNKTREFLRANRESHGAAPVSHGGSANFLAKDKPSVGLGESPFKTDAPGMGVGGGRAEQAQHFADHHQKLADHFRAAATSQPGDEAESLMEAAGETPEDELLEGGTSKGLSHGHGAIEGSPEEEAGELPDFEATEDEEPKKGAGLRNFNKFKKGKK